MGGVSTKAVLEKRGFIVYYVEVDWGLNFLSVTHFALQSYKLSMKKGIIYLVVSSPKCKKCSVMLLKVERIRCKQLSGALEAERFARPSV